MRNEKVRCSRRFETMTPLWKDGTRTCEQRIAHRSLRAGWLATRRENQLKLQVRPGVAVIQHGGASSIHFEKKRKWPVVPVHAPHAVLSQYAWRSCCLSYPIPLQIKSNAVQWPHTNCDHVAGKCGSTEMQLGGPWNFRSA